jgi:WhiB family redox-sensing transcriptional regulator
MIERESVDVWVGNEADTSDETGLPCHREDPELFFAESPTDVELAKQVCAPCPLRSACLDAALERREPWGVWGGELVQQGVVVPRKRGPGRPRKDAPAYATGVAS